MMRCVAAMFVWSHACMVACLQWLHICMGMVACLHGCIIRMMMRLLAPVSGNYEYDDAEVTVIHAEVTVIYLQKIEVSYDQS